MQNTCGLLTRGFPVRQEKMLMRLERDRYAAKVRSLVLKV